MTYTLKSRCWLFKILNSVQSPHEGHSFTLGTQVYWKVLSQLLNNSLYCEPKETILKFSLLRVSEMNSFNQNLRKLTDSECVWKKPSLCFQKWSNHPKILGCMHQPSPARLAFPSAPKTSAWLKRLTSKTFWQVSMLTHSHTPTGNLLDPSTLQFLSKHINCFHLCTWHILPVLPQKCLTKHLVLN